MIVLVYVIVLLRELLVSTIGSAQYVHNSVKLRHARSYGVETTAIASSNFALP